MEWLTGPRPARRRGRSLGIVYAVLLLAVSRPGVPLAAPAVTATRGMAVTANPLASRAAVAILEAGGNAADAAITAAFVLAVVEPYSSGLGGGGLMVVHDAATGEALALDCRETAPAAARPDMFLHVGVLDSLASQDGGLSVAVPGLVRGLHALHSRSGRLPWPTLVGPAIALARDGFPVYPYLRDMIVENAARLDAAASAIFAPGGRPLEPGDLLIQEDLAATLQAIAERGADAFYSGPIAASIVASTQRAGGELTEADLATYQARWREPLRGRYRGLEIVTMPPPSAGGVQLLEMLALLEGLDLSSMGYGSAKAWHTLAEAMRFSFADRVRWLGDPDQVEIPVHALLDPRRASVRRTMMRPNSMLPWATIDSTATALAATLPTMPTPADADTADAATAPNGPGHTTHISIVDADGNAIAATLTINLSFGSGVMAGGTGILLNDEMDDFAAAPGAANYFGLPGGAPNTIAPGKRPLSSMTPTIVLREGRVHLVLGSPGGSRIITSVLQVFVNVVDFGMDIAHAVSAPRIHHQGLPPLLYHEPFGLSPDTALLLRQRGHELLIRPTVGNVQAILVDPETGMLQGASDPRGVGEAWGY